MGKISYLFLLIISYIRYMTGMEDQGVLNIAVWHPFVFCISLPFCTTAP